MGRLGSQTRRHFQQAELDSASEAVHTNPVGKFPTMHHIIPQEASSLRVTDLEGSSPAVQQL